MMWNFTDNLSEPGEDRKFALPLSSTPPASSPVTMAKSSQFTVSDNINDSDYYSSKKTPVLTITIQPQDTETDFIDVDGLPNPAIRLHAMAQGELYFEAANSMFSQDHLILKMSLFSQKFSSEVPWYERWHEAQCIPQKLIYENIDTTFLDTLISSIPVGGDFYGVSFPPYVNYSNKDDFITKFKNGTEPLIVKAGAIIGKVAVESFGSSKSGRLNLHGRYARHSDDSINEAWPFNPREFFYLLFGNDSIESLGALEDHSDRHPLLSAIENKGDEQVSDTTNPTSVTKSMKLRPPLRTHQRLIWEATIEEDNSKSNWMVAGSLNNVNIYSRLSREDTEAGVTRVFDFGNDFSGYNKCNIFGFDISLRSGFRACIIPFTNNVWRYMTLLGINQAINNPATGNANPTNERIPLTGAVEDKDKIWAYIIEPQLEALPLYEDDGSSSSSRQSFLRNAIEKEGRNIVIPVSVGSTGHFLILKSILGPIIMAVDTTSTNDVGIRSISATMMQAGVTSGASDWTDVFKVKDDMVGILYLRAIELHPGGDPDHYWGLQDLSVRNTTNWN